MKRLLLIIPVIVLLLSCKDEAGRFLERFNKQRSLDSRFVGYWSTLGSSKDIKSLRKDGSYIKYFKKDGSYITYYYDENSKYGYRAGINATKESTYVWGYMPGDNAFATTDRDYLGANISWDFKGTIMYGKYDNIHFKNKDCFIGYLGNTSLVKFNRVTDKDILEKLKKVKPYNEN